MKSVSIRPSAPSPPGAAAAPAVQHATGPAATLGAQNPALPSRAATLRTTTPQGKFAARSPLSSSLAMLAAMRDRKTQPLSEPVTLASIDLTEGLRAEGVNVPALNVSVTV